MNVRVRQDESRRGTALMLALLLVIILGTGAAAAWKHMHVTLARGQDITQQEAALQLAEGGIDRAIAALRIDSSYRGETQTPLGEGFYTVEVRSTEAGHYVVSSMGTIENAGLVRASCGVEAQLALSGTGEVLSLRWFERRRQTP